ADEAQHHRWLVSLEQAHRGKPLDVDAIGDDRCFFGGGAVSDFTLSGAFKQRHYVMGRIVADTPQRFVEPDPEVAVITDFGWILLKRVAIVPDPVALKDVDATFLGVDAMLAQDQRALLDPAEKGAQKTRITGGNRMENPGRYQAACYGGQLPDRAVHAP